MKHKPISLSKGTEDVSLQEQISTLAITKSWN